MKPLRLLGFGIVFLLGSCVFTDNGVVLKPSGPDVVVCLNAVSDTEASSMKAQIKSESFENSRMDKAKAITKDRCFKAHQVVVLMDAFSFEDSKLELAKLLYRQTEDQQNYEIVVDALTFESDKKELRDYIAYMN